MSEVLLPDDVILHIFSMLRFIDLFAVAGTCRRLRQLAHYSFKLHPKEVIFTLKTVIVNEETFFSSLNKLHAMLQFIGPLVRELTFDGINNEIGSRRFFDFIVKYCRPSKIKCIKLLRTNIEMANADRCHALLNTLEKLEMSACTAKMLVSETFILKCKRLRDLTLFNLNGFDGYYIKDFSRQLESINLQNLRTWQNTYGCFEINVGRRTKSLILREVSVNVKCDDKDLSNIQILQLRSVECFDIEFLSYVGNELKQLQLQNIESDGKVLFNVGNPSESISLLEYPNLRRKFQYIYDLLQKNNN